MLTPTQLRANLYQILNEVLETKNPIEILCKGQIIKLVPKTKLSKLSRLKPHPHFIQGDAEQFVHLDQMISVALRLRGHAQSY